MLHRFGMGLRSQDSWPLPMIVYGGSLSGHKEAHLQRCTGQQDPVHGAEALQHLEQPAVSKPNCSASHCKTVTGTYKNMAHVEATTAAACRRVRQCGYSKGYTAPRAAVLQAVAFIDDECLELQLPQLGRLHHGHLVRRHQRVHLHPRLPSTRFSRHRHNFCGMRRFVQSLHTRR